jgi:predicted PurR-regulated permease PerM
VGVILIFNGDLRKALSFLVIWGVINLFRRVAEPKVLGSQTGLSPVISLLSIYIGMRLGGVLGMILGPILCLVFLNIYRSGIFEGLAADLKLAVRDIAALLGNRPKL